MGGAVPCVDGSILGHEVGFALREHLLGKIERPHSIQNLREKMGKMGGSNLNG